MPFKPGTHSNGNIYPQAVDQIREILIHRHYLSQKDVAICLGFDLASLGDAATVEQARELHGALMAGYRTDSEDRA